MGRIIVFSGPPLSGKSTLATAYGAEAGAPVLDVDAIRLRVLPDSQQSTRDRNVAYACMHYTAEQLLVCGIDEMAVVATYARRDIRRDLVEIATRCGAQLYILQFRVTADAALRRFEARPPGHAAVDLTPQSVSDQAVGYPYYNDSLIVDTANVNTAAALAIIVKYLNREEPLQAVDRWINCGK